jgi:hypothetical protein
MELEERTRAFWPSTQPPVQPHPNNYIPRLMHPGAPCSPHANKDTPLAATMALRPLRCRAGVRERARAPALGEVRAAAGAPRSRGRPERRAPPCRPQPLGPRLALARPCSAPPPQLPLPSPAMGIGWGWGWHGRMPGLRVCEWQVPLAAPRAVHDFEHPLLQTVGLQTKLLDRSSTKSLDLLSTIMRSA